MTSRRTKISPKSGRGLGHATPTIFGSTVGYPSDSLASCYVLHFQRPLHHRRVSPVNYTAAWWHSRITVINVELLSEAEVDRTTFRSRILRSNQLEMFHERDVIVRCDRMFLTE